VIVDLARSLRFTTGFGLRADDVPPSPASALASWSASPIAMPLLASSSPMCPAARVGDAFPQRGFRVAEERPGERGLQGREL